MIIDAHQHFWLYDPTRDAWIDETMARIRGNFLPNDLKGIFLANQIAGCVAVQADQSEAETDFLLTLADANDFIKGVVGWVDLRAQNLPARLDYFSQFERCKGFRHVVQAETDDAFMLQNDFKRGIRQLQAFDFTYDLLVYPRQLPAAIELVNAFGEQKFVLDHIGKPPVRTGQIDFWRTQINELARADNVWCKLSGIVTEADWNTWTFEQIKPYLDVVFDAFGTNRLMFGSDWPVCTLAGEYEETLELVQGYCSGLSETEKRRVFAQNATDFYGLE